MEKQVSLFFSIFGSLVLLIGIIVSIFLGTKLKTMDMGLCIGIVSFELTFFSGCGFIGLGEIIRLLQNILEKDTKAEEINKHNN